MPESTHRWTIYEFALACTAIGVIQEHARAYVRASLKPHRRWLAANRLDHVTLTPGAGALAVATDTYEFYRADHLVAALDAAGKYQPAVIRIRG